MRDDPAFVSERNLIMEKDGESIGQVVFVRSQIILDGGIRYRGVPDEEAAELLRIFVTAPHVIFRGISYIIGLSLA